MTSLTDAAAFAKKASIWVLIGVATIGALFIIFTIGKAVKNALIPQKPLPATVAFGKLPKLELDSGIKAGRQINFKVETISAELPTLTSHAKVFRITSVESTFGAIERVKIAVSKVGFTKDPAKIEGNILQFIDPRDTRRIITVDALSNNFDLTSDFLNNQKIISSKPRSVDEAINESREFIKDLGIESGDFQKENAQTKLIRISDGRLVEATSLSSANLVLVNFYREEIDKLPILSLLEEEAPLQVLVASTGIVAAQSSRVPISFHIFSTYPLKGTLRAFEDLKMGKGVFNKAGDSRVPFEKTVATGEARLLLKSDFQIRDVSLGYVETQNLQEYLQPVYIFKSDDNLFGYVAAVDDAWTK